MLTHQDRAAITSAAIADVRAQWRRGTDSRSLGDIAAEIQSRMEAGTFGQASFDDLIVEAARAAHAATVTIRDDVALDGPEIEP